MIVVVATSRNVTRRASHAGTGTGLRFVHMLAAVEDEEGPGPFSTDLAGL